VVTTIGPGVEPRWLDQRVVADLGSSSGGYAQIAVANVAALHQIPPSLSYDEAVAMVGTGRTTMAILEAATPHAGDVVVVTAAAGGIGSLLIQALRAAGSVTVGLASKPEKIALLNKLGSTHAVDYAQSDWSDEVRQALDGRPITLVLDGVGGKIGRAALELLGVGGRLVLFGSSSGEITRLSAADVFAQGITVTSAVGARILQRPGGVRPLEERALSAAATGQLKPVIGQSFPLADAAQAHSTVESRSTMGKTILHPYG
jgi:NADPH:quinone reductase